MVKNVSTKWIKPCNLTGKKKNKPKRKLKKPAMHSSMFKNEKQIVNPDGMALWMKTYETCINWHQFYQKHYWKNVALNLKTKNYQLQKKVREYEKIIKTQNSQIDCAESKIELEYDTSSGSECEDDDTINKGNETESIDEEYLKFLEITYKHREEIKKERNSENENTTESNIN